MLAVDGGPACGDECHRACTKGEAGLDTNADEEDAVLTCSWRRSAAHTAERPGRRRGHGARGRVRAVRVRRQVQQYCDLKRPVYGRSLKELVHHCRVLYAGTPHAFPNVRNDDSTDVDACGGKAVAAGHSAGRRHVWWWWDSKVEGGATNCIGALRAPGWQRRDLEEDAVEDDRRDRRDHGRDHQCFHERGPGHHTNRRCPGGASLPPTRPHASGISSLPRIAKRWRRGCRVM